MKNLLTLIIVTLSVNVATFAFSGNGSGTENDPYQIETLSQLAEMANDLEAHYLLMNDIDASETENWNNGKGWKPIGNSTNAFKGGFDGGNHKITYLYINRPDESYIGLFGIVDYSPIVIIKNLELKYLQFEGYQLIGGIVGEVRQANGNYGEHLIKNCKVNGEMKSATQGYVGGISGKIGNNVLVKYCKTNILLRARHSVGGIVGINAGEINSCIAEGALYATSTAECYIGGVAGKNQYGRIEKSSADVNIDADGSMVGGLVGENYEGEFLNCFARGSVSGGTYYIGGLVGVLYDDIYKCYSTCDVSPKNTSQVGGLIGKLGPNKSTNYCYWDKETSGYTTSASGHPKSTVEMKSQSTYSTWDFDNTWTISANQNDGYPDLQWKYQAELAKPTLISPSNNSAVVAVDTVIFDWNSVSYADDYLLQISRKSDFSEITLSGTVTSSGARATNLTRNTKYYWRVRAQNDISESVWSDIWNFTTEEVPVPSYLTVEVIEEGLHINWGNAIANARFYLYRKLLGEEYDYDSPLAEMLPTLEYIDETVEGGHEYCYVVRAKLDGVFSDDSEEGCSDVPIYPANEFTGNIDGLNVELSWIASQTPNVTYSIYRRNENEEYNYSEPLVSDLSDVSYTDIDLAPGSYFYTVRAAINGKESDDANEINTIIPVYSPTELSATLENESVRLNWQASIVPDVTYNIYRRIESEQFNFNNPIANNLTVLSYLDNSVQSKTYYYVVRAEKEGIESENSNEASTDVDFTKPNPPSFLVIDELKTQADIPPYVQVPLSWGKVDGDNIVYDVYRSTNETTGYTKIKEGLTETHFVDFDTSHNILKYGVEYYYKVKARKSENESDFSPVASSIEIEFRPYIHGFSFTNTEENMWPRDWWEYNCDSQPYENHNFIHARPFGFRLGLIPCITFPDWNLWVGAFDGVSHYRKDGGPDSKSLRYWVFNSFPQFIGSCNGFTTAALLEYSYPISTNFKQKYKKEKIIDIELDIKDNYSSAIRNDINKLSLFQYSKNRLIETWNYYTYTPNKTTGKIKESFKNKSNSRGLLYYGKNKEGKKYSHSILPYKITTYSIPKTNEETSNIYVYDSNKGGNSDSITFVNVNITKNYWSYVFDKGMKDCITLFPDIPVSEYSDGDISFGIKKDNPSFQSTENLTNIYFSPDANVTIKNKDGNSVNNQSIFDNANPWATPIIPITGGETDVIGFYYLEDDNGEEVDIEYEVADIENNRISLMSDKSNFINTFTASSIGQKQNYFIAQDIDSVSILAEGANENFNLAYINDGGNAERTIGILNSTLAGDENLTMRVMKEGEMFEINNFGYAKSYDLYFSQIDSDLDTASFVKIDLGANQKHQIWVKNWNDLRNTEVYVYKDTDFNGSIDDTLCLRCVTHVENDFVKNTGLNLYPNPAANSVRIEYHLMQSSNVRIEINDLSGKTVFEHSLEHISTGLNSFDIKELNLTNGVYLVTVTSNQKTLSERLIILK